MHLKSQMTKNFLCQDNAVFLIQSIYLVTTPLTEFSITSVGCYLHLQVLVCWHDCAKYFCDVMFVPSLYQMLFYFSVRSFLKHWLAHKSECEVQELAWRVRKKNT